jgi:hypothetical protein
MPTNPGAPQPPPAEEAAGAVNEKVARLLSRPRVQRYRSATPGGTLVEALALYRWNLRASAAFYESIHYVEVSLRNVIDGALTDWQERIDPGGDPWYRNQNTPLAPDAAGKVREAIRHATNRGTIPEVHGRVVAELSFGFWRSTLSDAYIRTLWQDALRSAFAPVRRARLHDAIKTLLTIRNRSAHYQPIYFRDLVAVYALLLWTAGFISPDLETWIKQTSAVPTVLAARPSFL